MRTNGHFFDWGFGLAWTALVALIVGTTWLATPARVQASPVTAVAIAIPAVASQHMIAGLPLDSTPRIGVDTNGDGYENLVIGVPGDPEAPQLLASGYVLIASTSNPDHNVVLQGTQPGDAFGFRAIAVSDFTGNWAQDVLVSAPLYENAIGTKGRVFLFQGSDGMPVGMFSSPELDGGFGYAVAEVGDQNGDGVMDFAIGAPWGGPNGEGAVYIFSGATGIILKQHFGERAGDRFGASIARAGDVNSDGMPDYLIGAPHGNFGGRMAGQAYLYSGASGQPLHMFYGEVHFGEFGSALDGNADLDGDSIPDIVISAPKITYEIPGAEEKAAGQCFVFHASDFLGGAGLGGPAAVPAGAAGLTLMASIGGDHTFGGGLQIGNDANQDGVRDIIVGASTVFGTAADPLGQIRGYIFSGADGSLLDVVHVSDEPEEPGEPYIDCIHPCGSGYCQCITNALAKYRLKLKLLAIGGGILAVGCIATCLFGAVPLCIACVLFFGGSLVTALTLTINEFINEWYACWSNNACGGVPPDPPFLQ